LAADRERYPVVVGLAGGQVDNAGPLNLGQFTVQHPDSGQDTLLLGSTGNLVELRVAVCPYRLRSIISRLRHRGAGDGCAAVAATRRTRPARR
jgi:hypothetical protein